MKHIPTLSRQPAGNGRAQQPDPQCLAEAWGGENARLSASTQMRSVKRRLGWAAGCALLAFNTWAQVVYPGPEPGGARVFQDDGGVVVSNAAICARWQTGGRGVKLDYVLDVVTQARHTFTGETFEIVLTNGTRVAASALERDGKVKLTPLTPENGAARLAECLAGRQAEVALRSADGRFRVVWRVILHDGGNYFRQEIDITPAREDCVIQEIAWLNEALPGAQTVGRVDGSPMVAGNFFFSAEDPHASNAAQPPQQAMVCRVPRNAVLARGSTLRQSFVFGVAPSGQMRRGFLGYLERERAHPYRPYLHYNSWYDTAWTPFALNETNCLEAIRLCGERFIQAHGVVMDAMVFDDGWDDPKTLWEFHGGFPRGFAPLTEACQKYHTRLGVWLSPFGGYGEPKKQRMAFGRQQGFEVNATGFSMAGPKYYAAFKRACVEMIRKYGVEHFKFDGIATGSYASGGGQYLLDTEAMRRLMSELRRENPRIYINLTTGSWPSPFWLRDADSVWRQGDDMGHAGKGSKQQQWLTYRDQEVLRNVVRKGPLFPLNALMTQGVAYSRHGMAGDPTFNSAGFRDDVRAFFGGGTSLQELYIQPGKLTAEDWRVLAEAAKWSRANADVLVDTHWIGGDPSQQEVYGYASWSPRKGVITLRNPDDQPREYVLDVGTAFELPRGAAAQYTLASPWAEDAGQPPTRVKAGEPLRLTLKPFEVRVLDAVP